MWVVAGSAVAAACVTAVAVGAPAPETPRAEPPEGAVAPPPSVSAPSCRMPLRAPRIFVDLEEAGLDRFEAATRVSRQILRAVGPGLCAFIDASQAKVLDDALAQHPFEITVVSFLSEDLDTADVHLAPRREREGAVVPKSWRVGLSVGEAGNWRVVRATQTP